jgi:hypothetical protein
VSSPADVPAAPAGGRSSPLVTLHLWGVERTAVPQAVLRMATLRRTLAKTPGLTFHKLLGTGDGRTFTVRDADPLHWGLLSVWDPAAVESDRAPDHPALASWRRVATSELAVTLRPVAARGTWAGGTPFGDPLPRRVDGPVASLTRARIATRKAATFWRSVPPVSADLHQVPGLALAVGIGEAPVGLQGTFSLWDDARSLTEFAHRRSPHVEVVRRTASEGWYVEELFARFEVLDLVGTFPGLDPGWSRPAQHGPAGRDRPERPG